MDNLIKKLFVEAKEKGFNLYVNNIPTKINADLGFPFRFVDANSKVIIKGYITVEDLLDLK